MLLLIISLFLNCDLFSCVNYEKSKFNETAIMKQHHKNYLEVKTFIKEAQKKFHKDTPAPRAPHYTTRDMQSRKDTSLIALDQHALRFSPFATARLFFPDSVTPYTTKLNAHYLKWDEIYPLITTRKTVQNGPKVSSSQRNPSLVPSKITLPNTKYQKRFGPTLLPVVSRLRMNPVVNSTLKSRPNAKLSSKTVKPSLKNQNSPKKSSKTVKPSLKNQKSTTKNRPARAHLHGCTRSPHANSTFPTSVRGHSSKGSLRSYMIRNEEYKKKWLREITTHTPVDSWFMTLANYIGLTPKFSLTNKHASQLERTPSKTQVSDPRKQLKTYSKDQGQLRNGLLMPENATKVDGYSESNTKKTKFIIEHQGGILHLRTVREMDEGQTSTVGKRPVPVAKDVKIKITATTEHILRRDREPLAFKPPSRNKSRRIHLKPKRKRHHDRKRHHKNVARQRFQKHKYNKHGKFSYEDVDYRRKLEGEEYSSRSTEHGEPFSSLQFPEYINTEDKNLSKLIKTQKESRRMEKAQKDKIAFFNQVKETLKQVESKKKTKRWKKKAELLRRIVEGSSYSDEEESLRKNLVQALQNGSWT